MKTLMEYIESLYDAYIYDLDYKIAQKMEHEIKIYIFKNYRKIKQQQYVYIEYNNKKDNISISIDSLFKKELEKYYPEKLI